MRFIRPALIAVTLCTSVNVFSQTVEESVLRQISPLTPNAASFSKYGDVPVSLYTGIPNISIPIYEIKVDEFTLPISLSYHAGGVQVEDLPSWVGTGWSLNAGGVINCRMRGVTDYRMVNLKNDFADEVATILDPTSSTNAFLAAAQTLKSGKYDTESDIFSISTGTLSYKFFLDVDGNQHGMPARKLQITPEGSASFNQGNHVYFARWRVKDESGVEYIFGRTLDNSKDEFEVSRNEIVCGAASGDQEFVNTWYLNQINLPGGESIYFTYEYFSFCRQNMLGESYADGFSLLRTSTYYMRALRIKEITFPTGKVEFVPGDLRRDVANDKVLDRIRIFSKRSGNYVEEKSFRLVTNNPAGNTTSDDESFRLALLSVTEFDKDGTPLPPYNFEYKHSPSEPYTLGLPARGSFAQDLWGYYNGKTTNPHLTPNNFPLHNPRHGPSTGGADRSISPGNAQAGILTKIIYPTKGTTQFFYESNVARGITQEDANLTWGNWQITPRPFANPVWDLMELQAAETKREHANVQVENKYGNDVGYDTFKIINSGYAEVMVSARVMYAPGNTQCEITTPAGVSGALWDCLNISLEKKAANGTFASFNNTVYFGRIHYLQEGEYRVKVQWKDPGLTQYPGTPQMQWAYAYVDLDWTAPVSPYDMLPTDCVVGGLRIAKIVDSDGDTGQEIVRWFNYNYDENVSGLPPYAGSSGIIQNTAMRFHYRAAFTPSQSSILQTHGGLVGYRKVAVTYGADQKGGKQVSYFTSAADYPDGNLAISKELGEGYEAVEVDWRRGLIERVVDLKYENNGYKVVRESEKKYTFLKQPSDPNNYHHVNIRVGGGIGASTFKTVSESIYMHQSIERVKDLQSDVVEVVTTTTFEQNPQNLAVSKTTTTNSKGDQVEVVTRYPVDYANVENINVLKTGNIISVPIKTETTKNNKLIDGVIVKYTDIGDPKEVYRYEDSDPDDDPIHSNSTIVPSEYVLKSQFSYNTENKLAETRQANNYPTAYVWGYDRSFPVVKIENMGKEQIPSSLISNIEAHTFTGSTQVTGFQGDVDFLNAQVSTLRNNTNYRVTTYTYNAAFGLTSQTDPNGITTYFESDGYGRLQQIRDHEKNILKTFKYHYKSASPENNNYNHIISNTILTEGVTNPDDVSALGIDSVNQSIQYLDGLGRPMQAVSTQGSPGRNDIVQPSVYDAYGREYRKYLPVTVAAEGTEGWYKPNLIDATGNYTGAVADFYDDTTDKVADDPKPYAETIFESSPLNRVIKQGAPGEAWQPNTSPVLDKSIKKQYGFNTAGEVILFEYDEETARVNFTENGVLKHYGPNQLYANKTFDEHNNETVEFLDKEDRLILRKVQYGKENDKTLYAETYYVYDDFGNLVMVLSPEATKNILDTAGN
jgi:YD repeat-containing protein